ncbi:MAG: MarR family transcriptional regulator [Eubacteriales bacterium]|nr:MarR family transcriptional regulator [Eubacteriales bacterium]
MDQLTDLEIRLLFHHVPFFSATFFQEDANVFKEHDEIRHTHVHAVIYLKINGPSPMSKVAQLLGLEKGSFTPIANQLISWGYIEREIDPTDKRKSMLKLTESGCDFAIRVRAARSQMFSAQIDKLSTTERKQFFAAMQKMQDLLATINGNALNHPYANKAYHKHHDHNHNHNHNHKHDSNLAHNPNHICTDNKGVSPHE